MRRRTSVSTPAQSPRIENDQSCTSARCPEQADRPGSGPLTSNKSTKALENRKKECTLQIDGPAIGIRKINVPLEIVSAGDH